MAGEKWTKTADALIAFVKATTQQDRIWITFFESDHRDFADKPLGRDALLRDPNFQTLAKLGTAGGTELLPALRHVLKTHQRFSARRRAHLILITDGQVGNEEAVLQEVSGKTLPVHCFGIDHAVNEAFLRQLSGQQRGTSVFLTPNDNLVRPIAILGSRLSHPVLTHLALDGDWELAATELPDIYGGQVAFASIRAKGNRSDLKLAGQDIAGRPLTVQLQAQAAKTDLPKLIWTKHRIESLLQVGKTKEAIVLAEKANLVCRGAAFIAWDDAEEVAIAQDEVYQPSLDVPIGLSCSMHTKQAVAFMPAPSVDDIPFSRQPSPERRPPFSKSKMREWWEALLARPSNEEPVNNRADQEELKPLTDQLNRIIESVFSLDDAKKLTSFVLDWAMHMDDKHAKNELRPLLRKCGRDGDARFLRKVLSNFFLALPDPWRTRASLILSPLTTKTR
jgi:von Willebrand factor type A domain